MEVSMWTSFLAGITQSPEETIEILGREGWPQAELCSNHAQILLERGDPEKVGAEYARMAKNNSVKITQGHLWLQSDIVELDRAGTLAETMNPWLDLFLAVGIKGGVLHPGGDVLIASGASHIELHDARCIALAQLADYVNGTDLVICIENIPALPTAADVLDLINSVGSENLGVCLDTGHLHLVRNASQSAFIRAVGSRLKALHIADNDGTSDQHRIPLFDGFPPFPRRGIDWRDVMQTLAENGYDGPFNFEIPGEYICTHRNLFLAKLRYVREIGSMLIDGTAFL